MNNIFLCPICRQILVRSNNTLKCEGNHCFDISKEGYINLLLNGKPNFYENKVLFLARKSVYEEDFFAPIQEYIEDTVMGMQVYKVVDAGCGEGSLLNSLFLKKPLIKYIGIDISKVAIKIAAKAYKGINWCVGDLCKMPLDSASIDCIVNMLTPANYNEFRRIISPNGLLIKVVPQKNHLKEIRNCIGKEGCHDLELDTVKYLKENASIIKCKHIKYSINCDESLFKSVYEMTPLTVDTRMNHITEISSTITVDVLVLIAKL